MPGEAAIPAKLTTSTTGKTKQSSKKSSARSGTAKKDEKRDQAQKRNQQHQNTKSLRIELRKVEKEWERAEHKVAELQAQLADPYVYDDSDRIATLAKEFDGAKDRAAELSARWEELASKLERFNA